MWLLQLGSWLPVSPAPQFFLHSAYRMTLFLAALFMDNWYATNDIFKLHNIQNTQLSMFWQTYNPRQHHHNLSPSKVPSRHFDPLPTIRPPTPDNHWFVIGHHSLHFLEFNMNGIKQYILFCVWLPLPHILRFIRGAVGVNCLLLFSAEWYSGTTLQCDFPLTCGGHSGYFPFLAITNKGSRNTCVQVLVWTSVLFFLGG